MHKITRSRLHLLINVIIRGADKSLARTGRKKTRATKL